MVGAGVVTAVDCVGGAPGFVVHCADLLNVVAVIPEDIAVEELTGHCWGTILRRIGEVVGGLSGTGCGAAGEIEDAVGPGPVAHIGVRAIAVGWCVDGGVA